MKQPEYRNPHDPFIDLTPVKCSNCDGTLMYANQRTPTRTVKLVCSMSCAAEWYGTKYVRVTEP